MLIERIFFFTENIMEYTEFEYEKAKSQSNIFINIIELSILEVENQIREAIKLRWSKGISVNDGKIGEYYSLSYKNLKLLRNPSAGGSVDLTFTGALGDGISVVRLDSGKYEIISTDSKYFEIGTKYGFDEFGLSESEMAHFMSLLEKNINNRLYQIQ